MAYSRLPDKLAILAVCALATIASASAQTLPPKIDLNDPAQLQEMLDLNDSDRDPVTEHNFPAGFVPRFSTDPIPQEIYRRFRDSVILTGKCEAYERAMAAKHPKFDQANDALDACYLDFIAAPPPPAQCAPQSNLAD